MELEEYSRVVIPIVACTYLLAPVEGARGQTADVPATSQEEIVVWGQRPALIAGAAASMVTAADADTALAKDIGELLQSTVPGITGQRLGGAQVDPVLRGTRAERVNVTIDGAQVHGACPFRMDPETALLDVADFDQIEVVKGPYSVTSGPVGIGGTIDIRTKDPLLSPSRIAHGSAMAGYTSNYGGWSTHGSGWVGAPRAAFRLTGAFRDFGNYSSGNGERVPSSFQNRSLGSTLVWQPTQGDRLRLAADITSARDVLLASAPMDTEKEDAYIGVVRYERQLPITGVEEVAATGYYNYVDHHMSNAHKPNADMIRMLAPLDAQTFGGRVRGNLSPIGPVEVALGGDVYRAEHDGTREMTRLMGPMAGMVMTSTVWPDAHILDGGVFAEATVRLAPRLRGVTGVRLDFVDAGAHPDQAATDAFVKYYGPGAADPDAFETNVSVNARLIYSLADTVDLFVGMGRAVRTASTTERFFVFGPARGGYLVGNPALDPEESFEIDIGAGGQWRGFSINGSFFYNRIQDYILPVLLAQVDVNMDGQVDLVRGFRNADAAKLLGVDWGAAYAVTDQLSLLGSIAYVYGQNEGRGQPLPEIPPLEGTLGLRFERSWAGGWFAWIMPRVRMVARQGRIDPDFGEDESPGFVTVDCFSGLRLFDRYELDLNLSNLFDTNYHEHMTRENPFTGAEVPEPGRMVYVALRVTL